MKKHLIIIMALMILGSSVMAQPQQDSKTKLFGSIHNSFYFKPLNIILPVGDYLWGSNMADAKQFGFGINFGSLFYFHKVPIANVLKFGLDVTYLDANYIMFKRYDIYTYESNNNRSSFIAGTKLGPVISINPVSTLIFDAYFQLEPSVFGFDGLYDDFSVNFNLRKAFGLNISYSKLLVGFEVNLGKMSESYSIDLGLGEQEFENTYDANCLRISFGFKF